MSIYVGRDYGEPAFLCSNQGWADACSWIDSLPADADAEELNLLRLYGWSQDLPGLRDELREAPKYGKPSADVARTLQSLSELCQGGDDDAIVITDGMSPVKAK